MSVANAFLAIQSQQAKNPLFRQEYKVNSSAHSLKITRETCPPHTLHCRHIIKTVVRIIHLCQTIDLDRKLINMCLILVHFYKS